MTTLTQIGQNAKSAARALSVASSSQKNAALLAVADAIEARQNEIIAANKTDLQNAVRNGMSQAMQDRLALNEGRIKGMADGVRQVAALGDPVGRTLSGSTLYNGMKMTKITVPIGVIGIIFESRPNVTSDAAALCLKSGNACILRGGSDAINSNIAIAGIMRGAIESAGLPADCVSLIEDTDRATATGLMRLNEYVDCLIPRGGAGLIRSVVQNATVPVIETGVGNCHIYVEGSADADMAANIIFNAKTQRPSVCNACESLLVDENIAEEALPKIAARLAEKNVEIRGCEKTRAILKNAKEATEEDYAKEFLDYIISVKVVKNIDEALDHIAKYSTGHSESIITRDFEASQRFVRSVDSAAVYVNASTRFTDGGEFGLGAEIGISTQKLHARGPMGLNELVSYKYVVLGDGQIRE
ncbi:MAG: glutamate-5-semialdehyde dehydrogenase [Clostridia bacterium]|nr:glutamate-5-semialdehyde dehydrogenase [Clostridia bacterium]